MRASIVATAVLASLSSLASAAPDPPAPAPDLSLDVYAEPAQLVDIGGGRHLNLRCSGSGAPTVILESGQGMTSMAWRKLQPLVAKTRRVCAYDRAGLGFSDAAPLPRTAPAAAGDLYALVHAAGIQPPLLLVGHSMGSYVVRLYASAHPQEVAGLVLVDPVSETLAEDAPDYAAREAKASAANTDYGRKCAQAARAGEPGWNDACGAGLRAAADCGLQPEARRVDPQPLPHRRLLGHGPVRARRRRRQRRRG